MISFGVGRLWGIPSDGSTPVEFGILQDVSLGFSWDKKELYGSLQFPVKVVRGKGKIDCKAGFAQINALAFNLLLGGSAGVTPGQYNTTITNATIPASTPYTITTTANLVNLGVMDVSGVVAIPMKLVTSGPVAGQYTYDVATGKYTFAAADEGKAIQYAQQDDSATGGSTITIPNLMLGNSPIFKTVLYGTLDGKQMNVVLNACMSTKFDMAFKQEDFIIPQFDFSAFADASGNPGTITIGE